MRAFWGPGLTPPYGAEFTMDGSLFGYFAALL